MKKGQVIASPKELEQIRQDRRRGHTIRYLAKKYKKSPATIVKYTYEVETKPIDEILEEASSGRN